MRVHQRRIKTSYLYTANATKTYRTIRLRSSLNWKVGTDRYYVNSENKTLVIELHLRHRNNPLADVICSASCKRNVKKLKTEQVRVLIDINLSTFPRTGREVNFVATFLTRWVVYLIITLYILLNGALSLVNLLCSSNRYHKLRFA